MYPASALSVPPLQYVYLNFRAPPPLPDISRMHILAAGVIPQGTKAKKVVAEEEQKVGGTTRTNSRENSPVVVTVNAVGEVLPPLIFF